MTVVILFSAFYSFVYLFMIMRQACPDGLVVKCTVTVEVLGSVWLTCVGIIIVRNFLDKHQGLTLDSVLHNV